MRRAEGEQKIEAVALRKMIVNDSAANASEHNYFHNYLCLSHFCSAVQCSVVCVFQRIKFCFTFSWDWGCAQGAQHAQRVHICNWHPTCTDPPKTKQKSPKWPTDSSKYFHFRRISHLESPCYIHAKQPTWAARNDIFTVPSGHT